MAQPLGISFIPTADNQLLGTKQGQMEGDLASAFKILSLRLPRVQGAQAIAPPALLNGQGSAGVMGGFNPYAAVFDALLKAAGLSGGSTGAPGMPSTAPGMPGSAPGRASGLPSLPGPRVTPTSVERIRMPIDYPASPSAPQLASSVGWPFNAPSDFRSWNRSGGREY